MNGQIKYLLQDSFEMIGVFLDADTCKSLFLVNYFIMPSTFKQCLMAVQLQLWKLLTF